MPCTIAACTTATYSNGRTNRPISLRSQWTSLRPDRHLALREGRSRPPASRRGRLGISSRRPLGTEPSRSNPAAPRRRSPLPRRCQSHSSGAPANPGAQAALVNSNILVLVGAHTTGQFRSNPPVSRPLIVPVVPPWSRSDRWSGAAEQLAAASPVGYFMRPGQPRQAAQPPALVAVTGWRAFRSNASHTITLALNQACSLAL